MTVARALDDVARALKVSGTRVVPPEVPAELGAVLAVDFDD